MTSLVASIIFALFFHAEYKSQLSQTGLNVKGGILLNNPFLKNNVIYAGFRM